MTKWHNLKFAAAKHIIFKTNHALDNARRGTKMIIMRTDTIIAKREKGHKIVDKTVNIEQHNCNNKRG